jgi:hypothetical protein
MAFRVVKKSAKFFEGDTLEPLSVMLTKDDIGYELTGLTVTASVYPNTNTESIDPDASGYAPTYDTGSPIVTNRACTAQPPKSFTANATTDKLYAAAHGLKENDRLKFSTSGTLPAGINATDYFYAVDVSDDRFRVADEKKGESIDITTAGTGTHNFYICGHVQLSFESGELTAGTFGAVFTISDGTDSEKVPPDGYGVPLLVSALIA